MPLVAIAFLFAAPPETPAIDRLPVYGQILVEAHFSRNWSDELVLTENQLRRLTKIRADILRKVLAAREAAQARIPEGQEDTNGDVLAEGDRVLRSEFERYKPILLEDVYVRDQVRIIKRLQIQKLLRENYIHLFPPLREFLELTDEQAAECAADRAKIFKERAAAWPHIEVVEPLKVEVTKRHVMEVLDKKQRELLFEIVNPPNPKVLGEELSEFFRRRGRE